MNWTTSFYDMLEQWSWFGLFQRLWEVIETSWNMFTVTLLFVSLVMALSVFGSGSVYKLRRDGSRAVRAYTRAWFAPFLPITYLRALMYWRASVLKKNCEFMNENDFPDVLMAGNNKKRQILYFTSEHLLIVAITALLFYTMKIGSHSAYDHLVALMSYEEQTVPMFSLVEALKVVGAIFTPSNLFEWFFLLLVLFTSVPYVSGIFYEPYRRHKSLGNTSVFCQHFAKKWTSQISCMTVIMTVPELGKKFFGLDVSLVPLVAKVEPLLFVFFIAANVGCVIRLGVPLLMVMASKRTRRSSDDVRVESAEA